MICYKLIRPNGMREGLQFTPRERTEVEYTGVIGSRGVIHAYHTAEDAVVFYVINCDYCPRPPALLWECEFDGPFVDGGTKIGVGNLTPMRVVGAPVISTEDRVRRAILAAKAVYTEPGWNAWADRWLSGEDRSSAAAWAVERLLREEAKSAEAAAVTQHATWESAWAAEWAEWVVLAPYAAAVAAAHRVEVWVEEWAAKAEVWAALAAPSRAERAEAAAEEARVVRAAARAKAASAARAAARAKLEATRAEWEEWAAAKAKVAEAAAAEAAARAKLEATRAEWEEWAAAKATEWKS
jgi:hypothetical protein